MIESVQETVEVEGWSAEELFDYWSRLENLCDLFSSAEEASHAELLLSRWLLKGPLGQSAEFGPESFRRCAGLAKGAPVWSRPGQDRAADVVVDWGEIDFKRASSGRTLLLVTAHFANPPETEREGSTLIISLLGRAREHMSRFRKGSGWYYGGLAEARDEKTEGVSDPLLSLLDEWNSDESGYDEETLPWLKEALDRDRTSDRKLFGRG